MVRKNIFKQLWWNWIINQCIFLFYWPERPERSLHITIYCSRKFFLKKTACWLSCECWQLIRIWLLQFHYHQAQAAQPTETKRKNTWKRLVEDPDDPVMTICHPSWLWHTAYIMWTQFLLRIWFLATNYRHWTNIEIALHLSKRRWRQVLFPSPSLLRS